MSKYDDPNDPGLAMRMHRAVGDDLMRQLVADGRRGNPQNPWPRPEASGDGATAREAPPAPTYVQWAAQRGWTNCPPAKARDMYLTAKTAGKDVGPVAECPVWRDGKWVDTYGDNGTRAAVPHRGWVDPPKVADWRPPGQVYMDALMDTQDAIDRRKLARDLG